MLLVSHGARDTLGAQSPVDISAQVSGPQLRPVAESARGPCS